MDDRRLTERPDRRALPRGGRRNSDNRKPWYLRRRLWLTVASLACVGWRRLRRVGRSATPPREADRLM